MENEKRTSGGKKADLSEEEGSGGGNESEEFHARVLVVVQNYRYFLIIL